MLDDNDDNVPAWNDRDYTYEEVFVMIVQKSVKSCPIQAPMQLNFSFWQPNPEN